ncbi:lytic transglycosylase domain-containing protein [Amylibacter sp. IMCC11727]|uniref:lytic transglycosylase domain-containing protein n=1 Tax=Amylibacter sp. IMCC11727 TaxID=3039851 RepID=UPI00244DD570|nr:lytic transglycosylase domain-containing protein [Amylibacter sp. IMCC11727]WGI22348.1 lytic transglycosylase domain-containing protein [Amylibacter sp. IMCC11727]
MRSLLTAGWIGCFALLPLGATAQEEDGDLLATAFSAVASEDWVTADHYASQMSDPVGSTLVTWQRLRRGEGHWEEYTEFLRDNPDWPGLKRLRRRGEAAIPPNHNAAEVRAYFRDQLPQTGTGSLRLAEAFAAQGRTADARAEAIRAWTTLTLQQHEMTGLLNKFAGSLSRYHQRRMDFLLWGGHTREAGRMLPLITPDQQKLAQARIALQRASKGVDAVIAEVPKALQSDGGLAYDRFQWRVKKGRWDDAQKLLVEQSTNTATLGIPEKWGPRRRGFARRAMRMGDTELAYWLASQHGLKSGADYADLEWLAGFISLTKLDAPEQAVIHFRNHRDAVKTPVSLGRAGYWIGRAEERRSDFDAAVDAFNLSAKYQTSFYGQLSAERLGAEPDERLTGKITVPDWREGRLANSSVVRAGILLHHAQEQNLMRWFFSHVAETTNEVETAQLAELALEYDRPFVALGVAKEAAKRGFVIPKSYFPVTELARYSVDVDPEVAMAIARRESELNPEAVSPVGARGLMQVMPATARQVAGDIGVEYSKNRLTSDWRYNAKLGTAYLGGLLEIYEGSYVLAFAAYNAGPNRVDQWIETYGDPRDSLIDQVDWIEHIPYRETRNYVMRVIESLHVYRMRLSGEVEPIRLTRDLTRG